MILERKFNHRFFLLLVFCFVAGGSRPALAQLAPEPKIVSATIGFNGIYKLGCWTPLTVELRGGSQAWTGRLAVSVPDTDGVPTRVYSDPNRPVGIDPEQTTTVRMNIRVGQSMSPLQVQFFSSDGKVRAKRKFSASYEASAHEVIGGKPSTNRILLEYGPSLGLGELVKNDQKDDEQLKNHVVHLESADDLPTRWYGYESVETVIFTTSAPEQYRPLLQNRQRIEALTQWVQRGGQVVIFCASGAEELLANGGALAELSPGNFEKMKQLTQAQPIETFSGAEQPISPDRRVNLQVPSLLNVRGKILASAGQSDTTVPLVIRTRLGFGEIVFVGLDFDRPPLRDWAGRNSFLSRVIEWQGNEVSSQSGEWNEMEDLSALLRNSLDIKFVGVQVVPFGLVALLVGIYILLIGPGDYLFVKRVLRRTELTWLTFPLIVIGVSVLAYGIANRLKGDQVRVNQVEIIDVDCTADSDSSGDATDPLVRGTVWTHFFTPQVNEYDLRLQPSFFKQQELTENKQLVSWLGLPGYALGGMQAGGAQTSVFDSGYQFGDQFSSMRRLPVQVWSTKTLTARWSARVASPLQVELRQDGDELLRGEITNPTEIALSDCLLLYGRWAYDLGYLAAGKPIVINDSFQPRTVKTLLTSADAGDDSVTVNSDDGTIPFHVAEWDIARLAKAMMFYQAINGSNYTNRVHRYQSFVDLSDLLEQDDVAILLAKCNTPGSQWIVGSDPATSQLLASDKDRRWTYYRFLLPVDKPESSD